ncbi:MAG: hypothetical protein NTX03_00675 [Bacteroidetes bacterium]|nr:hypothetical protein [Bacteroidota bacterium]
MKPNRYLLKIILISLILKLGYVGYSLTYFKLNPQNERVVKAGSFENLLEKTSVLELAFSRFDSDWYQKISTTGYEKIEPWQLYPNKKSGKNFQSYYAFFPLYPLAAKAIRDATGSDFYQAALPLMLVFSTTAFLLLFIFIRYLSTNKNLAFYTTLIFMFFPFGFYISMFYSEAIFFTLLMACFITIYKRKMLAFGFWSILLVFSRANGLYMALPLYLFYLERNNIPLNKLSFDLIKPIRHFYKMLWAFAAYCIILYFRTGDALAFSTAQKGWYRHISFPFTSLFNHHNIATQFHSVYAIIFMLIAIYCWRKWLNSFNIYTWIGILLPLSAGQSIAMGRFISLLFPFQLQLATSAFFKKYKILLLAGLILLHFASYHFWVVDSEIGF